MMKKMIFTKRFSEILESSGVKQNALASFCNVTKQSISDFKKGKSFPSIETLFKICQFLDVSSDYLLGLSDTI